MRGRRISRKMGKFDVVLEAVRYVKGKTRIRYARGYKRSGYVWSDLLLFDRKQLVELVKAKKKIACGRTLDLPGHFEIYGRIQFAENGDRGFLFCDTNSGKEVENLALPLF